ncbi:MAG: 4a-hydroxytetrahydrobiopterin dehydratase [Chlamydiales bacterium]|nr:4a-hydroxytetrahydrobiopterin dehydratase [Chlamydiales bacterium]
MEIEKQLIKKTCIPCKKGVAPLKGLAVQDLLKELSEGWKVVEDRYLEKEYLFSNFQGALRFANQIGEIAEAECHHPDLYLSYGKLKVQLWTHKIDGLSENDFILAAKCDLLKRGDG